MPGFDGNINVTVSISGAQTQRAVFNVMLIAGVTTGFGASEYTRAYTSVSAINADAADLGATLTGAGQAAFNQSPSPAIIYIGDLKALSVTLGLDAILAEQDAWYGLAMTSRVQADLELASVWADLNKRLYVPQSSDADILLAPTTDVFSVMTAAARDHSIPIYHPLDAEFLDVSLMAERFAFDPDVQSATWAYGQPKGVTVTKLSDADHAIVLAKKVNYFGTFYGNNVFLQGYVSNASWIDEIIIQDWAKARIEEAVATNFVVNAGLGLRIPYTDAGIQAVGSVALAPLQRGEAIGHFVAGSSTKTMPLAKDVSDIIKATRQLTFSMATQLSGAIQETTINVTLVP